MAVNPDSTATALELARRLSIHHSDSERIGHLEHAILAEREAATVRERERCAKIAESCGDTWSGSRDAFVAVQEAAVDDKVVEIAAAIRSPDKDAK